MYGVDKERPVHFIGIGGIGMSGIAKILLAQGYKVTGSDLGHNDVIEELVSLGAKIYKGHDKENVKDAQFIVRSTAINKENPEIAEALKLNLPVVRRAEMLAELMRVKFGIAVAGAHGKTTTTSILSTILFNLNASATSVIGGIVKNLGGHAFLGKSKYFVAEADESDGSFLCLNPVMSIITNIDNDHLDFYHTEAKIFKAFQTFVDKIPFHGNIIINGQDPKLVKLKENSTKQFTTVGISDEKGLYDFTASEIKVDLYGAKFKVETPNGSAEFSLSLSGDHNILNALCAIAVVQRLGYELSEIATALKSFEGVKRRFEKVYVDKDFCIIDDYGHHPTEIASTLKTARKQFPNKNLTIVFEPHRYSRTERLWDDFVDAFKEADRTIITPIYAASEENVNNISPEKLVADINDVFGQAEYLADWNLERVIEEAKRDGHILLCLGAGSISKKLQASL